MNRLIVGACIATVVSLVPFAAWAHAHPQTFVPAQNAVLRTSPGIVQVTFDDPIERLYSKITVSAAVKPSAVLATGGRDPRNGKALTVKLPRLRSGKYLVHWQAMADDGHPGHGDYQFTVR